MQSQFHSLQATAAYASSTRNFEGSRFITCAVKLAMLPLSVLEALQKPRLGSVLSPAVAVRCKQAYSSPAWHYGGDQCRPSCSHCPPTPVSRHPFPSPSRSGTA